MNNISNSVFLKKYVFFIFLLVSIPEYSTAGDATEGDDMAGVNGSSGASGLTTPYTIEYSVEGGNRVRLNWSNLAMTPFTSFPLDK